MEWVPTSGGRIPIGRHPIEGGYEEDGTLLYHAAARIDNVMVPGKTNRVYLIGIIVQGGACVPFGNIERYITGDYEIL